MTNDSTSKIRLAPIVLNRRRRSRQETFDRNDANNGSFFDVVNSNLLVSSGCAALVEDNQW
jgi:hypothetical protein